MHSKASSTLRQHNGMERHLFLTVKEHPIHNHEICHAGPKCWLNLHTLPEKPYVQMLLHPTFYEEGNKQDWSPSFSTVFLSCTSAKLTAPYSQSGSIQLPVFACQMLWHTVPPMLMMNHDVFISNYLPSSAWPALHPEEFAWNVCN